MVVADPDFIRIAERNMNGIVPLYYNMRKAEPRLLNSKSIYEGLNAAFTHGNIGIYSNNISKIWNSNIFINGEEKEREEATNIVKLLCMENNFCIDAAKTLYMPKRVGEFGNLISKYTNCKLPAFFEYAKDKDKSQVCERNDSFVNKLYSRIPNKAINTRKMELGDFNYKKMMHNVNVVCSKEVSDLYDSLNKTYRYMINMKDEYVDNLHYIAQQIRTQFSKFGYSNEMITDMLIDYLYGKEKRWKQLLWFCYGNYIVENLSNNVEIKKTKVIQCIDCGEWIEVDIKDTKSCRCKKCQLIEKRRIDREYRRSRRLSI